MHSPQYGDKVDTREGQARPVWLSSEKAGGAAWESLSTGLNPGH